MDKTKILKWFGNGETGVSSKCMALVSCGITPKYTYTPSDSSDLNRCIKLVEAVPEVLNKAVAISEISEQWHTLMHNWDELVAMLKKERESSYLAPKTNARMKELGL